MDCSACSCVLDEWLWWAQKEEAGMFWVVYFQNLSYSPEPPTLFVCERDLFTLYRVTVLITNYQGGKCSKHQSHYTMAGVGGLEGGGGNHSGV